MITSTIRTTLLAALALTLGACGHKSGSTTDANGTGDGNGSGNGDGGVNFDAKLPVGCESGPKPGNPQCSDCIDNDGDGQIDGFDIECTGPTDNDEGSFKTGIPGDNVDSVKQDCFFDGNSGAGNDGCDIHVCCLLGATTVAACPIGANTYDPTKCPPPIGTGTLSQMCIDVCSPLTPPGCDCFGCCSVCDANGCQDVLVNNTVSPNCDANTISDPNSCPRCVKVDSCTGGACGGTTCTLCPGQDPSTLPTSCGGTTTCPGGEQVCQNATCPTGSYCSNGCCIGTIQ